VVAGCFKSAEVDLAGAVLTNSAPGQCDLFLARFSGGGELEWVVSAGGTGEDLPGSVATGPEGVTLLCGTFDSPALDFGGGELASAGSTDLFVVAFSGEGEHLFSARYGGEGAESCTGMAAAAGGGFALAGVFGATGLDFGFGPLENAGSTDAFVAAFDGQGGPLWAHSFGGDGADEAAGVALCDCGDVYVAGSFNSALLEVGATGLVNTHPGEFDVWIAALDSAGGNLWASAYGGMGWDQATGLTAVADSVLVVGAFASSAIDFGGGEMGSEGIHDGFVLSLDAQGLYQWSRQLAGAENDWCRGIASDVGGSSYVTGYFESAMLDLGGDVLANSNAGHSDVFVVKYDQEGSISWSAAYGGDSYDEGMAVASGAEGAVYVTGYYKGSVIDFGGGMLPQAVGGDVFVVSLGQ